MNATISTISTASSTHVPRIWSAMHPIVRAAAALWLGATAVNFIVWLATCAFTMSLQSPWWVWTLTGGVVVAALHVAFTGLAAARPAPPVVVTRPARPSRGPVVRVTDDGDDW